MGWLENLINTALVTIAESLSTSEGIIAAVSVTIAGGLVVASSFVKTMIPLRMLAVASNVGFMVYGALHPSLTMLMLHATLLPINIFRTAQMVWMTRKVREAASTADLSGVWLRPYMRSRRHRAGHVLFRKGDPADHLFFLAAGKIEFIEIGQVMEAGRLFGEIAFFAPDKCRSLTARCVTACQVLRIDENTFRQLYFQNPAFGFEVVSLIAGRLMADRQRLEALVAAGQAPPQPVDQAAA
ncbi:Crp/Fnr family transcriptional regulator [Variovorax sp. OV329]|uniref:Crp/Fnr family transcriptional regulator n=1 Tax=Variovorax sp. OV329 TaxID=1882825 RepID=UPI0008E00C77|nr:cyclic nucleotide-binding domain-containing protein [Variovorax sp. OV329]SFN28076.1 Cyclic nucleotide-binding domain-containing protein [Variovorax sp. OV329]